MTAAHAGQPRQQDQGPQELPPLPVDDGESAAAAEPLDPTLQPAAGGPSAGPTLGEDAEPVQGEGAPDSH
jgi:hypothetical protein